MINPFWNVKHWWFMICKLWRTSMMIWWFWMIWLSNLLLLRWSLRGHSWFHPDATFLSRRRGPFAPWPRFEANKKIENFTIHAKCAEGYKGWGWERGGKCVETRKGKGGNLWYHGTWLEIISSWYHEIAHHHHFHLSLLVEDMGCLMILIPSRHDMTSISTSFRRSGGDEVQEQQRPWARCAHRLGMI